MGLGFQKVVAGGDHKAGCRPHGIKVFRFFYLKLPPKIPQIIIKGGWQAQRTGHGAPKRQFIKDEI